MERVTNEKEHFFALFIYNQCRPFSP